MRIGILTFHWATNYGAILQAWCLQQYLLEQKHEVDIINYKPSGSDYGLLRVLRHPSLWSNFSRELANKKKERKLQLFRKQYLKTTKRYFAAKELEYVLNTYDIIISGSDQIFSPSFTMFGDNGKVSPVYWQGFRGKTFKSIGYAVSFGCEKYPDEAADLAKQWVNGFNAIGTRERTGERILEQLEFRGESSVVPDPTLLLGADIYRKIGLDISAKRDSYTCVYMLRHEVEVNGNVRYIDEKHHPLTMEQWLTTISNASSIITNSYHGTLMAIYTHVPFAILLETGGGSGMNDRFFTLLDKIGCKDRVATTIDGSLDVLKRPVDFKLLDKAIEKFRMAGEIFLMRHIR